MSNSVTEIERGAFFNCTSLQEINLPNTVTSIGDNAFNGCYQLVDLTLPSSIKSIASAAFNRCENLTTIYSYCHQDAFSKSEVFSRDEGQSTMYVSTANLEAYQAMQTTYWDLMNITISDTLAP